MPDSKQDIWAQWILQRRFGGDRERMKEEAIGQVLTSEEAEAFVAHLRPLVEAKRGTVRSALAYLWAIKR